LPSVKDWEAFYFDGRTAKRRIAKVRLLDTGLSIRCGRAKAMLWPYEEVRQAQGLYEGEPVRLERGPALPEAILFADAEILTALHHRLPSAAAGKFHDPSTRSLRTRLTVYAGIAILALGLGLHFWVIPALANYMAGRLPQSWEKNLGESTLEIVAPQDKRRMAPQLQGVIDSIVARLAVAGPSGFEFKVIVIDDPMVNAFALPGGSIVVMSGLLEKTKDPNELAGVLAHEMQHVIRHHATRQILENSQTALLLSVISGDASGSMFGAQAAFSLAQLRYSRRDEAEADREGMRTLIRAGLDPKGMVNVFEMLKEHEKVPDFMGFLSTHPGIDERLAALRSLASAANVPVRPILLPKGRTWQSLVLPERKLPIRHVVAKPARRRSQGQGELRVLGWAAPEASRIMGYNLYMADTSHGHYRKVNDSPIKGLDYLVKGLKPGKRYYFVLTSLGYGKGTPLESKPSLEFYMVAKGPGVSAKTK
jgi:Zn-dependent protease with chaperone function